MLLSPLRLRCGLTLPNRFVKSAISEGLATAHMLPTDRHVRLYRRWAAGGAGLLVTGNVMIDRAHAVARGDVAIGDAKEAFRRWAAASAREGLPMLLQLSHPGRQTPRALTAAPVAPSAVLLERSRALFAPPRALSPLEIEGLVQRFADAARFAEETGFAGVQLHAAHGYLVSQFLSPKTNCRRDEWGGTPERRCRFLLEVVRAVRRRTSPSFAVAVKLNASDFLRGGLELDESMEIARRLDEEGIDLLEVTGGTYESEALLARRSSARPARDAYFLDYVRAVRPRTSVPLLLTGGQRRASAMEAALQEGAHDLVGLARPMVLVPDFPRRVARGEAPVVTGPAPFGLRATDSAMELAWYTRQLHRLADGLEPQPDHSRATALLRALAGVL